ncbi:MAG: hypothetical protein VKP57_06695 [Candidatus Sericytochromatia bacterium]|nr:hypothetical protein [Candidatus Sericytochromatia bacterium]
MNVFDNHQPRESIDTVDDPTRPFQYRIPKQAMRPERLAFGTLHFSNCGAE